MESGLEGDSGRTGFRYAQQSSPLREYTFLTSSERQTFRDYCPSISLTCFDKKGFGCGYVSFVEKPLSFAVLRLKTKPIS